MIQNGDINSNVDKDEILSLLTEWDAEYFMDMKSTFHMREPYVLKSRTNAVLFSFLSTTRNLDMGALIFVSLKLSRVKYGDAAKSQTFEDFLRCFRHLKMGGNTNYLVIVDF